jgi:hypothetical protein
LLKVDDQAEADFCELDTYERIVEAARQIDPRIFSAVLLAGDGGLRRGEIIALELTDLDFKAGRMITANHVDSGQLDPTRVDVSARESVAFGLEKSHVESALARAIEGAVLAGRWGVVAQLAKELEALRLTAAGVIRLANDGAKRAPPGRV